MTSRLSSALSRWSTQQGMSVLFSYVPPQWKTSTITPVPKENHPTEVADYRPISVTPILCRILEKFIVHRFFHHILLEPQLNQDFTDQFAFRPTGSTTACLLYTSPS